MLKLGVGAGSGSEIMDAVWAPNLQSSEGGVSFFAVLGGFPFPAHAGS